MYKQILVFDRYLFPTSGKGHLRQRRLKPIRWRLKRWMLSQNNQIRLQSNLLGILKCLSLNHCRCQSSLGSLNQWWYHCLSQHKLQLPVCVREFSLKWVSKHHSGTPHLGGHQQSCPGHLPPVLGRASRVQVPALLLQSSPRCQAGEE